MLRVLLICVMGYLFIGCTIKREISPVPVLKSKEVCIINNKAVREGFLEAYTDTLEDLGYAVKVLPAHSSKSKCLVSSSYTARWSWDMALYMSYAKIKVYEDSKLVGSALYDSTGGGGRIFDKFANGDKLIHSLVHELFNKEKKK